MNPQFKKGDRISFIDQKMDGTVSHVRSDGKLIIETDDGFDITTSPAEIILIESFAPPEGNTPELESGKTEPAKTAKGLNHICEPNTISFITQAYEKNKMLSGKLRCALVNNLDSAVLFTIYSKTPTPSLLTEGRIPGGETVIISDSKREELEAHGVLFVQYLICDSDVIIAPGKIDLRPKAPDLEDAVNSESGESYFCTMKVLYTKLTADQYDLSMLVEKFNEDSAVDHSASKRRHQVPAEPVRKSYDKIVDLHIEELVDDLTGLDPDMMLGIQRHELIRHLNKLMAGDHQKLIVIHGVGKGKLKQAVYEEVEKYPGLAYAPADPSLFGSGATEIFLR